MNNLMHTNIPYNNMKLPINNNMYSISNMNNNQMRNEEKDDIIEDNKSDGIHEEESINNISSIMPVEEDANISELN